LASEKCQNVHVSIEQSLYSLTTFCGTRQPFSMHLCSYFPQMLTSHWQLILQGNWQTLRCAWTRCRTGSSQKTML